MDGPIPNILPFSVSNTLYRPIPIFLALSILSIYVLKRALAKTSSLDPREPPAISAFVPYVGHILNLLRRGQHYFEDLCIANRSLPIFTVAMFTKKMYLIGDPALATSADRNTKSLSFSPFVVMMLPRLLGLDERVMEYVSKNADGKQGDWGLIQETHHGMQQELAAGSTNLQDMLKVTLQRMLASFDNLIGVGQSRSKPNACTQEISLFAWVRKEFAVASTDAIYGPLNPFSSDPSLEEDFWTVDAGFISLLFSPLPQLFARQACQARKRLTAAIRRYMDLGGEQYALGVFKVRCQANRRAGATEQDTAKFEVGDLIGVLVNATPMLFWSILHIFSDLQLLRDLRQEIDSITRTETTSSANKRHVLPTKLIQSSCPLLTSAFREILRYHTHMSTNRVVLSDTLLADRYLLKAGSIVCTPSATIHFNPDIWGADAASFNPRRFLSKTPSGGAWRVWGGGATICPGRFFATQEITGVLALLIARCEIEPVAGKWVWPEVDWAHVASSIHPPKGDLKVMVRTREGLEGAEWAYAFGEEGVAQEEGASGHRGDTSHL